MSRSRSAVRAAILGVVVAVTVTVTGPAVAAPTAPAATATAQLRWLVGASTRVPVAAAEVRRHVDRTLLTQVGGVTGFNRLLTQVGRLRLNYTGLSSANRVQAVTTGAGHEYATVVALDASGSIGLLSLLVRPPAPTSWAAVDSRLSALAPQVSAVTARVDASGQCTVVHGLAADRPRPLGSAFKLYVLGALAAAVAQGTAGWNEPLAIRDAWKSLPSGMLQDRPAGTIYTLQQYADYMISISDNTAADHLIHRLGRPAVTRQLTAFGNADPALTTPFPTTRELFTLKGYDYPALANAYLGADTPFRAALLDATAAVPRTSIAPWTTQAAAPRLAPVAHALAISDGGITLDPAQYPVTWFKGGSEPGVLTLNFLVRTAAGGTLVSSVMLSDPTAALDETAAEIEIESVVRGALALAQ